MGPTHTPPPTQFSYMTQFPTTCTWPETLQCGGPPSPAGPQSGEGELTISDVNSSNKGIEQVSCLQPALHKGVEYDPKEFVFWDDWAPRQEREGSCKRSKGLRLTEGENRESEGRAERVSEVLVSGQDSDIEQVIHLLKHWPETASVGFTCHSWSFH